MLWRSFGLLFLGAILSTVLAQDTAQCTDHAFDGLSNSQGEDPCKIGIKVGELCDRTYTIKPLNPGWQYTGPGEDTACVCSAVYFTLLTTCSWCQGGSTVTWSEYTANCTTKLELGMPSAISIPPTSDFFIPHWAFTPLKDDTVDFSAIGVDNQPEVTISASSTIQSSSISTTSPIAQSPIASPTQSPNTSPTQTSNTSPAQLPKIQPTVISTALSTATVAAERLTSIFAAQPTAISTAESATISAAQSTGISVTQFTTFATEFTSISTTPSAGILPTQSSSINSSSRSPSLGVIVGSVSGGVLVVLLAIIFCWLRRRRLSRRLPSGSGTDSRFRTDPFIFPAPAVLLPSKRLERGRNDFAQEWQQSGHESSFTKGVLTASPNFGYSEERPMIQKHSRNLSDETRATNDSDQTWTMVTQNQENLLLREEASGIQTSEFQLREMQIKMERLAAEFGEIRRFASPPAYQVSGPGIGYAI